MKAHPIREVIQHFILECRALLQVDLEVDTVDAALVKKRLVKYSHEDLCKVITFIIKYLIETDKIKERGVTLKACLSTQSLNLWKASTKNTKETMEAKKSFERLCDDIERSRVNGWLHVTEAGAREIVHELG